jgi:hypothetical protein
MRRGAIVFLCVILLASAASAALRLGDRGADVVELQKSLQKLGYYSGSIDGTFGSQTQSAVKAFQKKNGLASDGVAGAKTNAALARQSGLKLSSRSGRAALLSWQTVNASFPVGTVVKLVDVHTSRPFFARRRGGHLHADCEPLTAEDTEVLRSIYGGKWSWARRAVVVELGGQLVAGSINGMPHGDGKIADNGFPGHFCLHFYGSRTHGTDRVCPEHQRMILYAAGRK